MESSLQVRDEGKPCLPGLVIRSAQVKDAAALAELMNLPGVRHGTLRMPFTSVEEAASWITDVPSRDRLLLAWTNGELVGWASLTRLIGRMDHKGYLHIAVRDGVTGKGVGGCLMRALIDLADRWMGLRRLELDVTVDNVDALRFYRGFGFEVEGTRPDFVFRDGAFVDVCAMGRLNPSRSA